MDHAIPINHSSATALHTRHFGLSPDAITSDCLLSTRVGSKLLRSPLLAIFPERLLGERRVSAGSSVSASFPSLYIRDSKLLCRPLDCLDGDLSVGMDTFGPSVPFALGGVDIGTGRDDFLERARGNDVSGDETDSVGLGRLMSRRGEGVALRLVVARR